MTHLLSNNNILKGVNIMELKQMLQTCDPVKVDKFISYLDLLSQKNNWVNTLPHAEYARIFKEVLDTGLTIDGQDVTLQYMSKQRKLQISLNYQAYKNLVLLKYPNATFDIELVREGDDFSIHKENGSVIYHHKIGNAFKDRDILGAYCIIKNIKKDSDDILETISIDEINKIKKTARTTTIWDKWFSEMCLKTIIKRACKRHFRDITVNADKLDNENYDLSKVEQNNIKKEDENLSMDIVDEIHRCVTREELKETYFKYKNNCVNKVQLNNIVNKRKLELESGVQDDNT